MASVRGLFPDVIIMMAVTAGGVMIVLVPARRTMLMRGNRP